MKSIPVRREAAARHQTGASGPAVQLTPVDAQRVDTDQHLALSEFRDGDPAFVEHLGRAVAVVEHRSHIVHTSHARRVSG